MFFLFFFFFENENAVTLQAATLHLQWATLLISQNTRILLFLVWQQQKAAEGSFMLPMHIRSCCPRFLYLLGILLVSFKLIVINHKAEILKEIVNNPFIYSS